MENLSTMSLTVFTSLINRHHFVSFSFIFHGKIILQAKRKERERERERDNIVSQILSNMKFVFNDIYSVAVLYVHDILRGILRHNQVKITFMSILIMRSYMKVIIILFFVLKMQINSSNFKYSQEILYSYFEFTIF